MEPPVAFDVFDSLSVWFDIPGGVALGDAKASGADYGNVYEGGPGTWMSGHQKGCGFQ